VRSTPELNTGKPPEPSGNVTQVFAILADPDVAIARNVALPAQLADENRATAANVQVCTVLHVPAPLEIPLVQQYEMSFTVYPGCTPSAVHTAPEHAG
jgi:hypothetical protein